MKIDFANLWPRLILLSALLQSTAAVNGQGTVTFDGQPLWSGASYSELGMTFQVVVPQGASHDDMVIVPPNWANNVPQDSTPFMGWFRQNNPYNYVSLSLNGSLFGLASVQLADPNSPSLSPVPIAFIGYLAGGSTVTNTFTTPGNGASTFANYTFNSDFTPPAFTHVDILAPRWAMDNLVFSVPEPSVLSLLCFGLALLTIGRKTPR